MCPAPTSPVTRSAVRLPTCTRVRKSWTADSGPSRSHSRDDSVAVTAEFEKPATVEAARAALKKAPGLQVVDEPAKNDYPLPLTKL